MTTSNTLGEMLKWGYQLHGFCERCGTGRPLDLHALVVAHGEKLQLHQLRHRLRCRTCGGPGALVNTGPPQKGAAARLTSFRRDKTSSGDAR